MTTSLIVAGAMLAGLAMLCLAGLRAWRGWLELRRYEIHADRSVPDASSGSGVRIEMADLKERLRKLEAIATGVDP